MNNILSIVEQIIFLPKVFNETDESFYELLNKTNYSNVRKNISVTDIRGVLLKHPECISQWLSYSEANQGQALTIDIKRFLVPVFLVLGYYEFDLQ